MDSQSNQYFTEQRPSYPQSNSSFASISTSPSQTSMSSRHSPTLVSAAPVSSPSNQSHFTSLPTAMDQQSSYHFQQLPQQPQQHRGSFCEGQRGTGNDTMSFLSDFNLLAEAAKRAQMAVMMRDFDDLEM